MDTTAPTMWTEASAGMARTGWTIPSSRPHPVVATSRRARLVSAFCFLGVCVAMIGLGLAITLLGESAAPAGWVIVWLGLFGIPAALLLGWVYGPRAAWATRDEVPQLSVGVGGLAVVIGDLTVVGWFLVGAGTWSASSSGDFAQGLIGIFILGLWFCGVPALGATVLASLAWIAVFRRIVAAKPSLRGPVGEAA